LESKVYALGYGGWKDLQGFIEHLKRLGVNMLVDVRRFPRSKKPEFNGENLKVELPKHSVRYEYMGDTLGGFRRGGYQKYMETDEYEDGIRRLLKASKTGTVAIMCVERKSRYCHRRFIMQTLAERGVKVIPVE